MTDKPRITIEQAVRQVVAEMDGPVPIGEFIDRVLAIHPSTAKNRDASIRNALRWSARRTWVQTDAKTLVPIRTILQGVRFRHVPSRLEIKSGALLAEPTFDIYRNPNLALDDVKFLDARGEPLPTRLIEISSEVKTRLGRHTIENAEFELSEWFREMRLRYGDSRLEAAPNPHVGSMEAIAWAYAHMFDRPGYPGDHWLDVLARDKRMNWDGFQIRYAEDRTPIQIILGGDEWKPREARFTPVQGHQVYRFQVTLTHRPNLWRRIEIQGKQTLADFDNILRRAFNHDRADHLGGFWKRVRRGTGRKSRAVHLGDVDPFGGGEGAGLRVAGLGLNPGDELKYVYDFGDWIEHRITLGEIAGPEKDVSYPRVAAKNKPEYSYCTDCAAEGRQALATWVCLECSARQQRDVLVCRDCLRTHHMDHYADEILY
jgi:Plasmid pRiA4b ORF-3-like protein/snRNA-activating protein complex (SNAPc), subunit 3